VLRASPSPDMVSRRMASRLGARSPDRGWMRAVSEGDGCVRSPGADSVVRSLDYLVFSPDWSSVRSVVSPVGRQSGRSSVRSVVSPVGRQSGRQCLRREPQNLAVDRRIRGSRGSNWLIRVTVRKRDRTDGRVGRSEGAYRGRACQAVASEPGQRTNPPQPHGISRERTTRRIARKCPMEFSGVRRGPSDSVLRERRGSERATSRVLRCIGGSGRHRGPAPRSRSCPTPTDSSPARPGGCSSASCCAAARSGPWPARCSASRSSRAPGSPELHGRPGRSRSSPRPE